MRLNQLVEDHLEIVSDVCKELWQIVRRLGKAECRCIGNLALVEASRDWKETGAFGAFAKVYVRNAIRRAGKPGLPAVQLNGYDPEDERDYTPVECTVPSFMTPDEQRFMREVEELRASPRETHRILAARHKRKLSTVRKRHRRILSRVDEVVYGQRLPDTG